MSHCKKIASQSVGTTERLQSVRFRVRFLAGLLDHLIVIIWVCGVMAAHENESLRSLSPNLENVSWDYISFPERDPGSIPGAPSLYSPVF